MTLEELLERWGVNILSDYNYGFSSQAYDYRMKKCKEVVKRLTDESMYHGLALYLTDICLIGDITPSRDEDLISEIVARSVYSASGSQPVEGYVKIPIKEYQFRFQPTASDDVSGPEVPQAAFYGFLPRTSDIVFSPLNLKSYDDELDDRATIKKKYTLKNGESITVCVKGGVVYSSDIFVETLNVIEIENEYMGKNHDLDFYRTNENRLSEAELAALSVCLDPENDLYAAELDVAIKAFKAIFMDKVKTSKQSNTKKIISWVGFQYPGTSEAFQERIAKIINPKKTLPPAPLKKIKKKGDPK